MTFRSSRSVKFIGKPAIERPESGSGAFPCVNRVFTLLRLFRRRRTMPAHANRAAKSNATTVMPMTSAVLSSDGGCDDGGGCDGGGCDEGGGVDGGGGGGLESGAMVDTSSMVGTFSTVMPNAMEADSAVPRLKESERRISSTVMEAGMVMVAVMSTLAAATSILTSDLSTLTAFAIFCCKLSRLSE